MKQILLATLLAVLTIFVVTFIAGVIDSIGGSHGYIQISLLFDGVVSLVALIALVLWAIPIHLLLQRFTQTPIRVFENRYGALQN